MLPSVLLTLWLASLPAQASLQAELNDYINIYYLSQGQLEKFDAELSKASPKSAPGFLARSSAYPELLALRALREEKEKSITEKYAKADPGESAAFLLHLRSLDPAERLAAQNLLSLFPKNKNRGVPLFYANLEQELSARKSAQALVAARVKKAPSAEIKARLNLARKKIDFAKSTNAPSRIRPGSGPEGNINGSIFPAKTWALTFDDGPHPTRTPEVFANLKAAGKKATFFWLMECLETLPGIPQQALALGFSTNNHSWTHANLNTATAAAHQKEIVESTEKQRELYGEKPRFFRLPYGSGVSNQAVRKLIADQGMIHVLWNVDTLDWQEKDPAKILERTKQQMNIEKRGIILFHDIHAQSVEASKLLLKYSATLDGTPQAQRWVTIPEIVGELNNAKAFSTGR